ncbi:MAG: AIR synthase-related protein, partial [Mycobacteriales bacterium]
DEFGGSEWAWATHRHLGGLPPAVDLPAEQALVDVLVAAAEQRLVSAAHDLSDGGLAQALVESCVRGGRGARVDLPGDPFVSLFSESAARAVVAASPACVDALVRLAQQHGVPVTRIGVVGRNALDILGQFAIPLPELAAAWEGTLPRLFD